MRSHHFVLSAALAALFLTGCGGITEPSQNQVEPFSGTVTVGGIGPVHTFNVNEQGEVSVTITSLTTSAAVLGAFFGQPVTGGCAPFTQNNVSGLNRPPFSNLPIQQKGTYCIQMFDPGPIPLAVAQNYTIQVSHP